MEKIPISVLVIILSQLSSIGFGIFHEKRFKISRIQKYTLSFERSIINKKK